MIVSVTHCKPYLCNRSDRKIGIQVNESSSLKLNSEANAQLFFYLQPSASIDFCINVDITMIPKPLPATVTTSTNSRLFLKYWAIMMIVQSLVIPTPNPTTIPLDAIKIPPNKLISWITIGDFAGKIYTDSSWLTITKHHLMILLCKWCE